MHRPIIDKIYIRLRDRETDRHTERWSDEWTDISRNFDLLTDKTDWFAAISQTLT
jgi:hypothetical protein